MRLVLRARIGILRRLIERVSNAFPKARIRVRLDGGFASPEVLDFLDCEPKVEYLVNLAANAVLKRKAESAMKRARRASEISDQTEHVYGECRYATRKTWPWKRRVIYKAEVVRAANKEPKDNPRFVVTNLKQSPQWIYEQVYCQRGDVENRIKELHDGMQIGRTSCSNFLANTFRVLLTAAAYVLMQEMRLHLAPTRHARAQVSTLREHFLKLGAQVIVTVRRIVLHLPQAFPYRDSFHRLALSLGRSNWLSCPAAPPRKFLLVNLLFEVCNFVFRSSLGPSYRTQNLFLFNDFFASIAFGSRPRQTYCHATLHE